MTWACTTASTATRSSRRCWRDRTRTSSSRLAGKPALIRHPGDEHGSRAEGARLVACLMHGNEPSGFVAMVDVLRRGERFPFDLWVLIGNVRAATQDGLYAHRHLDDQEDFNRVWDVGPATTGCAGARRRSSSELRSADLEAAIDLHNNSGRNPYYAILPAAEPGRGCCSRRCAPTPCCSGGCALHTLMEALATVCPTVSVECGAAAPAGRGRRSPPGSIHRFLAADGFAAPAGGDRPRPPRDGRDAAPGHRPSRGRRSRSAPRSTRRPTSSIVPGAGRLQLRGAAGRAHDRPHRPRRGDAAVRVRHEPGGTSPTSCSAPHRTERVVVDRGRHADDDDHDGRQARRDCLFYTACPVDVGKG